MHLKSILEYKNILQFMYCTLSILEYNTVY